MASPAKTGSKDGEDNPFFSQLDAWAKARGLNTNGAATKEKVLEAIARGGSPTVATQVTTDNIDQLHEQGQVSDTAYRTFLKTGKLP